MIRTIGPVEAEVLLAAGGVDVVDVREPGEWATGHLPGARLLPLDDLRSNWEHAGLRDRTLFVCAKGGRSRAAALFAEAQQGVAEAYSLEGGVEGWVHAGLPVVVPLKTLDENPNSHQLEAPEVVAAPPSEIVIELDAIVGANLRELRAQRGFTLDILAGLTGVGRQTLGQIELGRTVPSLGTVWKIARAFDVPFSTLLAEPGSAAPRVLRRASAKRLVSADGRFSSRALFPAEQKGRVEFYQLWLAGHGREDAEAHAPGTRENLVVTSGKVALEVGKERFELEEGDAIVFAADVSHAYVNPASTECWMNLVMTYSA